MAKVLVKYNPYRLQTDIEINGRPIAKDNALYKYVKGKRLQEYIENFPAELKQTTNSVDFDIEFYGMEMDWDDFELSFTESKNKGILNDVNLKFTEGKSTENIIEKITDIFNDLREGPVEAFRDEKLKRAFDNVRNSVFPIDVIATMSSGKSTLINAMLAHKLMPSKNEACTATITEITDNDKDNFTAVVYNENGDVIDKVGDLTYEIMDRLNSNEEVHRIVVHGDIPFIDANTTALQLVDTPGPNNSQNQAHKQTTWSAINNDANNLILYVLNGTQLGTNDDAYLLDYVAEQIQKGGKIMRDRFLFVVNKMDDFDPETENISSVINKVKKYLNKHGIEDPQIFPCSAFVALNIRTHLKNVNPAALTMDDLMDLPNAAQSALTKMRPFRKYEDMHLEKYTVLAPLAKRELNAELTTAIENKDQKGEALIHSGIRSIEAAIIAYVKKYAVTKKIKDLVETFQEVMETNQVLANMKTRVATDKGELQKLIALKETIEAKMADGIEAQKFKDKIASFDPMPSVEKKTDELKDSIEDEVVSIFSRYDKVIESKSEAKRLVQQFMDLSSNSIAKLSTELESIINHELVDESERLLRAYQEKLTKFDDEANAGSLDFSIESLVKDSLQNLRESVNEWRSDTFAEEKAEEIGETTKETRTYYEKVGTETEEVIVGTEQVKVGTKRVLAGSHIETRTRRVKNPNKKWWSFWRDEYVDEDYSVNVDDYKDEDVYKTVNKYETVERDRFEERTETIEAYRADKDKIQADLVSKYRRKLDESIKQSLKFAEEQIGDMKKQFALSFDDLDELIKSKLQEIENVANNQSVKEKELEKSKQILEWIEKNKAELDGVLEV